MVEHGQTMESRQNTVLSGFCWAMRWTRLISVPIAHTLPGGDSSIVLSMNSVDPSRSAASTTSIRHSGWNDHLHIWILSAGLIYLLDAESGVHGAVPFPENDLRPAQAVLCLAAQRLERVPDNHVFDVDAQLDAGVATQVLIGQEKDALGLLERPRECARGIG